MKMGGIYENELSTEVQEWRCGSWKEGSVKNGQFVLEEEYYETHTTI